MNKIPRNEPFSLIELVDKIPLEKGIRSSIFQIRASTSIHNLASGLTGNSSHSQLNANNQNAQIECIETWDRNIYIGTSDGNIIHYLIGEYPKNKNKSSTIPYIRGDSRFIQKKNISDKKPVEKIIVIPSESLLLVLCDNIVSFLDFHSLANIPTTQFHPIKNVIYMCYDEAINSHLQICIVRRHQLDYISFDHGVHHLQELSMNDNIIDMKCYSNRIGMANSVSYSIIDIATKKTIPLFSYNQTYGNPLLLAINDKEFLFVTSTSKGMGLGVFVSEKGDATRGTLQWQYYPNSIAFQFPYILALMDDNTIDVHNIIDQQLIQKIYIPEELKPKKILNVDLTFFNPNSSPIPKKKKEVVEENMNIKIVLCCGNKIFALSMKPIDYQIKEMMNIQQINYAILLLEHGLLNDEYRSEIKEAKLRKIHRNAGYIFMNETLFDDSLVYFKKGNVNPTTLINLYDEYKIANSPLNIRRNSENSLLPESVNSIINKHLEKNYSDIDENTKDSFAQAFNANAKDMLMKYLEYSHQNKISSGKKQEIDTTLLKIYVENNDKKLYNLIKEDNYCLLEESAEILKKKHKYHAMALLYKSNGIYQKAIEIWIKIENGKLKDKDFPGINCIVDFLSTLKDKELIWKYSQWVLSKDQELGVKIFLSSENSSLEPNSVISYLTQFGNRALEIYLEYLITEKKK